MVEYGAVVERLLTGKSEACGPLRISHRVPWDWSRGSGVDMLVSELTDNGSPDECLRRRKQENERKWP